MIKRYLLYIKQRREERGEKREVRSEKRGARSERRETRNGERGTRNELEAEGITAPEGGKAPCQTLLSDVTYIDLSDVT